jgi:hypothetical protein
MFVPMFPVPPPRQSEAKRSRDARHRSVESGPEWIGRYGALLPLFRLVGVRCIAALWRVKSLLRHRSDRPKLKHQSVTVALTLATAK